jgi:lipoprotein NlpI
LVAKFFGDIPQNVNFALKAEVVRTFLDSKGIKYQKAPSNQQVSPADVADIARPFTVQIECVRAGSHLAVAPSVNGSQPETVPGRIEHTQQEVDQCHSKEASPDLIVQSCTALIRSSQYLTTAYAERGSAYFRRGDFDRAIEDATEAIRLNPQSANGFTIRGTAQKAKQQYDFAIADYNQALRFDPDNANVWYARGLAYFFKGDFDRAIPDYDQAIAIGHPASVPVYIFRGVASFYASLINAALSHFRRAYNFDPSAPYAAIWLSIANGRINLPSELTKAVEQIDMTRWPAPIIRFYLGQTSAEAVLGATADPNAKIKAGQVCEAHFYIGEAALRRGAKAEAMRLFRLAAANCPKDFLELPAANAELKALGASP